VSFNFKKVQKMNPESKEVRHVPPGLESQENNLAIDFDGVIHTFDKGYFDGTCYGEPIKGTKEALQLLSEKYTLIVFTAKVKKDRPLVNGKTGMQLVEEWLEKYNMMQYISEITHEKPRARYYIDDKGIHFTSWDQTLIILGEKTDPSTQLGNLYF